MSSKIDDLHFWDFESSLMPENQLIIPINRMLNYRQQDFMIIMDYYLYFNCIVWKKILWIIDEVNTNFGN